MPGRSQAQHLNTQSLRVFSVVARSQSMYEAAKKLGLTQPTVSQTISGLEKELKTTLFDRNYRPMRLTRQGVKLLSQAGAILDYLDRMVSDFQSEGSGKTVSDLNFFSSQSVSRSLSRFIVCDLADYAEHVDFRVGNAFAACDALVTGRADMVLSTKSLRSYPEIKTRWCFTEAFFVIAPRTYEGRLDSLEDLRSLARGAPCIRSNAGFRDYEFFGQFFADNHVPYFNKFHVGSESARMELVSHGYGWSMLSSLNLYEVKDYFSYVRIGQPIVSLLRPAYLMYKNPRLDSLSEKLIASVRRGLKEVFIPELCQAAGKNLVFFPNIDSKEEL